MSTSTSSAHASPRPTTGPATDRIERPAIPRVRPAWSPARGAAQLLHWWPSGPEAEAEAGQEIATPTTPRSKPSTPRTRQGLVDKYQTLDRDARLTTSSGGGADHRRGHGRRGQGQGRLRRAQPADRQRFRHPPRDCQAPSTTAPVTTPPASSRPAIARRRASIRRR